MTIQKPLIAAGQASSFKRSVRPCCTSTLLRMAVRPRFTWQLRSRRLALGERTLVMGVVNVTPDSFSDGGQFLDPRIAINHALSLLDEGADIVDVGGESTRPGKKDRVTQAEEIDRVLPVIEGIRKTRPDAIVSI